MTSTTDVTTVEWTLSNIAVFLLLFVFLPFSGYYAWCIYQCKDSIIIHKRFPYLLLITIIGNCVYLGTEKRDQALEPYQLPYDTTMGFIIYCTAIFIMLYIMWKLPSFDDYLLTKQEVKFDKVIRRKIAFGGDAGNTATNSYVELDDEVVDSKINDNKKKILKRFPRNNNVNDQTNDNNKNHRFKRFPVNKTKPNKIKKQFKNKRFRNVNQKKQFIFIHIPKTGGSSIECMLWNRSLDSEHKVLKDYMNCYRYRKYFKFSFVRNPYLRCISMFIYFKSGGNQKHDRWKICTLFRKINDLNDFVCFFKRTENEWFRKHEFFDNFCQTDYLFDGNHTVNFIGKFEHFEQDIQRLMKILNIHIPKILHENYNGNKSKFDGLMVTPLFVEFINDYVSSDFETFGYNKVHLKEPITLKHFKLIL